MNLKQTRFTEFLIQLNSLNKQDFQGWVFYPEMLFNSKYKWWGDGGRRDRPHEGLDLCLYRYRGEKHFCLPLQTKIPVMYEGVIVKILDDFLGKSVIVEHCLPHSRNKRFYTIYGHTSPADGLYIGKQVKEGDTIATLAARVTPKAHILPHLHISLGFTPKMISYDLLDWEQIGSPGLFTLLDPLHVFDCPCLILREEQWRMRINT